MFDDLFCFDLYYRWKKFCSCFQRKKSLNKFCHQSLCCMKHIFSFRWFWTVLPFLHLIAQNFPSTGLLFYSLQFAISRRVISAISFAAILKICRELIFLTFLFFVYLIPFSGLCRRQRKTSCEFKVVYPIIRRRFEKLSLNLKNQEYILLISSNRSRHLKRFSLQFIL